MWHTHRVNGARLRGGDLVSWMLVEENAAAVHNGVCSEVRRWIEVRSRSAPRRGYRILSCVCVPAGSTRSKKISHAPWFSFFVCLLRLSELPLRRAGAVRL